MAAVISPELPAMRQSRSQDGALLPDQDSKIDLAHQGRAQYPCCRGVSSWPPGNAARSDLRLSSIGVDIMLLGARPDLRRPAVQVGPTRSAATLKSSRKYIASIGSGRGRRRFPSRMVRYGYDEEVPGVVQEQLPSKKAAFTALADDDYPWIV